MTPLKPIENTTCVRGVASKRYPLNKICAIPDCDRTDVTAHHIFGRTPGPASDSWFVKITDDLYEEAAPHVTGLCGSGTTGHHGDVEEHRLWIKLEDGVFVVYDRAAFPRLDAATGGDGEEWIKLGPLDPQPCEPKQKRKKPKRNEGPVRVVSFASPQADLDAAQRIKDKVTVLHERFEAAGHEIGRTVTVERALDFTLLNAGEDDI